MFAPAVVRLIALASAAGVLPACADLEPPLRELHQAQGAIEAARAAGAERYAAEEYDAAVEALQRYDEAVAEHDYRLALNYAIDARERAQEATRQAADRRALVRSEVEHALGEIAMARDELDRRLSAVPGARSRAPEVAEARAALEAADRAVQEARSALDAHDYLAAREALEGVIDRLGSASEAVDGSAASPTARRG